MEDPDAVVLVTEWDALRALDLKRIKSVAKQPVMVDLRNIYRPDEVEPAGLSYTDIGRPAGTRIQVRSRRAVRVPLNYQKQCEAPQAAPVADLGARDAV